MYIKAKYPKVGNEFGGPNAKPQEFGSLYGGNQTSNVVQMDSRASNGSINSVSTSEMFGGNVVSIYTNTNNGTQLIFTNDSAFIVSDSDSSVTEIDTVTALEFANDSNFVFEEPINLISNVDFSQEGSELITNGDFSNGTTSWSFTSGATLTALGAKITHTPSAGSVSQPSVLTIGKSYKLTYEITESVSGGLKFNSAVNASMVTTVGVHTKYLEADATAASFSRTNSSNNDVTITNISVKEVGQDWTLGAGWSIGANKVIGDGTMGGNDVVRQLINFSQGTTYRFSFTLLNYVSGGLFIRNPFNGYLDIASANGDYSFDYVAGINDNYIDFRGNSFIGSITNIIVNEI